MKKCGSISLSAAEDAKFVIRLQQRLADLTADNMDQRKREISESYYANSPEKVRIIIHELVLVTHIRPLLINRLVEMTRFLIALGSSNSNFNNFKQDLKYEIFHSTFDWRTKVPELFYFRKLFLAKFYTIQEIITTIVNFPRHHENLYFLFFCYFAPEIWEADKEMFKKILNITYELQRMKKCLKTIRNKFEEYAETSWDEHLILINQVWPTDSIPYAIEHNETAYLESLIPKEEEEEKKEEENKPRFSYWIEFDSGFDWDQKIPKNPLDICPMAQESPTLIQLAALYGSERSFAFLKKQGAIINEDIEKFVSAGGKLSILRECEQAGIVFEKSFVYAAEYRRDHVWDWINRSNAVQYEWVKKEVFLKCIVTNNMNVMLYYATNGYEPVQRDDDWRSPIHVASMYGHVTGVKFAGGAVKSDVNAIDSFKMTAVHYACKEGWLDILQYLAVRGADFNRKDNAMWTPLHYAAQLGNMDIIKFVVKQKGVLINAKSETDWTPVHVAAAEGHVEILEFFQSMRADLYSGDATRMTPLHIAVKYGHVDVVKYLLKLNADPNLKDAMNKTCLMWCESPIIRQMLIENGAVESKRRY